MNSDISLSNYRKISISTFDKENRRDSNNFNLLSQKSFLRNKPMARNSRFDINGDEKTKFIFEYLYGMKGRFQSIVKFYIKY